MSSISFFSHVMLLASVVIFGIINGIKISTFSSQLWHWVVDKDTSRLNEYCFKKMNIHGESCSVNLPPSDSYNGSMIVEVSCASAQ